MATITINEELLDIPVGKNSWIEKLESKLNWQTGLRPAVHFIEDVNYSPEHILPLINKFDIGLLIKGLAEDADGKLHVDASVLNNSTRSGCPVMLVPEKFPNKAFEKIVYPTDLRFCRREVILFLCKYAKALNSGILVANVPVQGLPHIERNYALNN